ncbi:hypothetical protein COCVIDRAFT_106131, partial [Bipolaris victoriae FI3]
PAPPPPLPPNSALKASQLGTRAKPDAARWLGYSRSVVSCCWRYGGRLGSTR